MPIQPLTYDPTGVFLSGTGLDSGKLARLAPRLETARREMLDVDLALLESGVEVPKYKRPLDAGFHELPEHLLAEYRRRRDESQLGRILTTAARLRAEVDRVVVLGIGGSYMGARALMEACCHPYHNELTRAERGSRPRVYFEGNNVDNDAARGLLDLLGRPHPASGVEDRWAIVVASKSGSTLETAVAFRQFRAALLDACDGDRSLLARRVVPITERGSKLFQVAEAIGCGDVFPFPDAVGGRFSVLSAVGLLPAAILGLDVVQLLQGAAAMNEHFRTAPPEKNTVLRYVAVCHLMETLRGATTRVLSVWAKGLEAVGLWYDQLLAESLGKQGQGALPLTAVNTRDLHSRGQQHQQGPRDKLITNLIVDRCRHDPLPVGPSPWNQDGLDKLAGKTLPDLMSAAVRGTNKAYNDDRRPTADLHLPNTGEASLGQLFQMLMLATVVEGRLIGINPYGQPGVEGYKGNMNAILRK